VADRAVTVTMTGAAGPAPGRRHQQIMFSLFDDYLIK
jgi:hypothetical protein